jgi:hypothetical protein
MKLSKSKRIPRIIKSKPFVDDEEVEIITSVSESAPKESHPPADDMVCHF